MHCDKAWRRSVNGLNDYWKHSYSSERLYQFYTVMRFCASERSSFNAAAAFLRRSIDIINEEAPDDKLLSAMLHLRLAKLLLEQDQSVDAEAEAGKARMLLAAIPQEEPTRQAYEARTRLDLAELELRQGKAEAALAELEQVQPVIRNDKFLQLAFSKVTGDARLQLHQLDQAEDSYRKGIALAEEPLNAPLDEYDERRIRWLSATDGVYRGFVQVLLARSEDKRALIAWEWVRRRAISKSQSSDHLLAVTDDIEKAGLRAIEEPHLVYASFEDHLDIWIVHGAVVRHKAIPVRKKELLRLAHEFIQSCADPTSSLEVVDRQAEVLYGLLLQPVIGELQPAATVAIEAEQSLANLPMEALRSPAGQYFGGDHEIIYSPGILAEQILRKPLPVQTADPFLVVDASPLDGSGVLPGHKRPTEAITQFHPARQVITAKDVSLEKVTTELTRSVAFHFTGHGRRGPAGIALELTPDSYLRSQDFSAPAGGKLRLAVLAACSTGSADNGMLDSGNLVRALFVGGVPNVIASHWDVDSNSTGEFFRSFYLHIGQGKTAVEALGSTRKGWLAQHQGKDALRHPYYWAAFSIYGRAK